VDSKAEYDQSNLDSSTRKREPNPLRIVLISFRRKITLQWRPLANAIITTAYSWLSSLSELRIVLSTRVEMFVVCVCSLLDCQHD